MDGLTRAQVFQARELSESGIWSGRIAELFDVDEQLVLRALRGEETALEEPVPAPPSRPPMPEPAPLQHTDTGWPPPATGKRDWAKRSLVVKGRRELVKVREVRLWDRDVLINEALDVWCPGCGKFRTVAQLGAPDNRCPVGIIRSSGTIVRYDPTDPEQDGPAPSRSRMLDLMREPL